MADDTAKTDRPEDGEAKPQAGPRRFDLGGVLVLLIVLGFFAENALLMVVYKPWRFGMPAPLDESGRPVAAAAEPTPGVQAVLDLDPFLVNLADDGHHRYAKVRVQLGFAEPTAVEAIGDNRTLLAPARQSIIDVLGNREAAELSNAEGKAGVRSEIHERLTELPWPFELTDVFLTDLLVQF